MKRWPSITLAVFFSSFALVAACGSDDDSGGSGGGGGSGGSPEQTGSACDVADDCYPKVTDHTLIQGEIQCLDRVQGGYCTHLCQTDADCCAADGECETGFKQVCAPFESTGQMMCFLSCEDGDLVPLDGGTTAPDPETYCQTEASPDFICRSSGGGKQNRKVCVPGNCGVGADCAADADCATGLTCLTRFGGGYCGTADCTANAGCPQGSLCVQDAKGSYCARTCNGNSDCTFCRGTDYAASCVNDATFVEAGTTGSVCIPPS